MDGGLYRVDETKNINRDLNMVMKDCSADYEVAGLLLCLTLWPVKCNQAMEESRNGIRRPERRTFWVGKFTSPYAYYRAATEGDRSGQSFVSPL